MGKIKLNTYNVLTISVHELFFIVIVFPYSNLMEMNDL